MTDKKKNDYIDSQEQFSQKIPRICPVCQNEDFIWGSVRAHSYPFTFFPNQKQKSQPSAWQTLKRAFQYTGKTVNARQCTTCGNVLLFANIFRDQE